jgi:ADP-ribose pyrophosphatase
MDEKKLKTEGPGSLAWSESARELIAPCRIFDLFRVERTAPDGRKGSFFLLDAPDWVTVIPFPGPLKELQRGLGEFLMVEQYRHGSGKVTIEFPAGTVDPGEDPGQAALRELKEETGRTPESFIPLGSVCPNPAFMNNRVHFYLATGLGSAEEQSLDEHEEINIHPIRTTEVLEKMGSGSYDNGVMMIALAYLDRYLKSLSGI